MVLLALDTATDACSVALALNGQILERFELTPKQHSMRLFALIDDLLTEAGITKRQISALAYGRGPGSFTGLRIAAGVIQGLALALSVPVIPVSTLAAIAQDHFRSTNTADTAFVALDARMDEVFWGCYLKDSQGYARLWGDEQVTPAAAVIFPEQSGIGLGSGWHRHHDTLIHRVGGWVKQIDHSPLPRASAIAHIALHAVNTGQVKTASEALPVYLRDQVAKKQSEQRQPYITI